MKSALLAAWLLSLAPGSHYANVVRVIDGDTLSVKVPAWRNTPFEQISLRVKGIDTPESLTQFAKCPKELAAGLAAKEYAQSLIAPGARITFKNVSADKYFRIDADVKLPSGKSWADVMINAGLARPYFGGTKASWC